MQSNRLPYNEARVSTEGQEHVPSAVGPLAPSLSSIHSVMQELIKSKPWERDSQCVPIPWRQDVYDEFTSKKLRIGVLADDGVVRPHPAVSRVLEELASRLKAAGHDLIPWDSDLHRECIEVMDLYYTVDGCEDIRRDVEAGGEPYIPHVEKLVHRGKAISVYEYWQLNKRKRALQQAYLEKWNSTRAPDSDRPIDAIIMPVMPHAAVPHRQMRWVGYTKVWNLLDYTALVVPGGSVRAEDCNVAWNHEARNDLDAWNAKLWTEGKEEMARIGFSVGVQIVGRRLEEEKVLAVGKVVDDLIKKQ